MTRIQSVLFLYVMKKRCVEITRCCCAGIFIGAVLGAQDGSQISEVWQSKVSDISTITQLAHKLVAHRK